MSAVLIRLECIVLKADWTTYRRRVIVDWLAELDLRADWLTQNCSSKLIGRRSYIFKLIASAKRLLAE